MIYVGIDIACDKHNCCIIDERKNILSEFAIANSRDGFDLLLSEINRFDDEKVSGWKLPVSTEVILCITFISTTFPLSPSIPSPPRDFSTPSH